MTKWLVAETENVAGGKIEHTITERPLLHCCCNEDHFGDITTPEAQTVHHILAEESLKWQNDYLKIYHKEYNELPPQYQPSNPGTYFIFVPPLPIGPLNPLGQPSRKPPPAHYTP